MAPSQTSPLAAPPKAGFVLIAVLVIIMLCSMVALSLMFHLRAEETALAAGVGGEQAWAAAVSGVKEAMRFVSEMPPGDLAWQDSPETFQDRLVVDDGLERWYFSVFSPGDEDHPGPRFGLSDEASRINLNIATEEMLLKLPGVTPYLAQGLLDFIDIDTTPRPEGAEQEYYDTLATPYATSDGPLSTLDEILLVRGFTPAVFYGEDSNLNFQLDPNENDGEEQFPPDNRDSRLDPGLRSHLTVCSYDVNEDSERAIRPNINDPKDSFKTEELPPGLAEYIAALRKSGRTLSHVAELLDAKEKLKNENGQEVEMSSGVGKDELAVALDRFTTKIDYRLPGLINVNTASAAVLKSIPEVDEALADSIISTRKGLRSEQRRTPAWLVQENVTTPDQFKKLAPYITGRSLQYHFHVVGYGMPSGRYRVLEVIIDMAPVKPAITYLRDITRLGMPFKITPPADMITVQTAPGKFLRSPRKQARLERPLRRKSDTMELSFPAGRERGQNFAILN